MGNCLILDMNGVLRKEYNFKGLVNDLRLNISEEELKETLWKEFWNSEYDICRSENEAISKLRQVLNSYSSDSEIRDAYIKNRGACDKDIIRIVTKLKFKGEHVGVLTDCDILLANDNYKVKDDLGLSFLYSSSIEGITKSEDRCYTITRAKIGHKAKEIYFLDDNENNVELAKKDGWNAFTYNEKTSNDVIKEIRKAFNIEE